MQRAVLVVREKPTTEKAGEIARRMIKEYGETDATSVAWELVNTMPDWVPVGLADQLKAHRRDTPGGQFAIVWIGTEVEIRDLAENGDPLDRE